MFRPVNSKVDFPKMEENILKFWEENDICNKSIEQRPADNEYVFYDGPPFATGLPHFGHFVPGTIKDAIPRYQAMKGKRVVRRFGWDCHGLPVEVPGGLEEEAASVKVKETWQVTASLLPVDHIVHLSSVPGGECTS